MTTLYFFFSFQYRLYLLSILEIIVLVYDHQIFMHQISLYFFLLTQVGQFCVSPDHVYLDSCHDMKLFQSLLHEAMIKYFGTNPQKAENFTRIINTRHQQRLVAYRDVSDHGGTHLLEGLFSGGSQPDENDLWVEIFICFFFF